MSKPILSLTGPLHLGDLRILDQNTVHTSGTEEINGQKTFNNIIYTNSISNTGSTTTETLISSGITNTGNITTSGSTTTETLISSGITNTGSISNTGNITTSGSTTTGTLISSGVTNTGPISNTGNITTSGSTTTGTLISSGITNTGNISTSGNLLLLNGKKYLRLLNISNYNNISYVQSIIIVNTTPYIKIDLSTIIKSSLSNTFLSIQSDDCIFNEIGDYYVCLNIIYSIDTTLIKKININFSFDNLKSMIDQDISLLNFKYQNDLSQIYNITDLNNQYLRLYVQCSDSITLTIHKINLDIVKLN